MTSAIKSVDGVAVIAEEEVLLPLTPRGRAPVPFVNMRKLLLANDTEVYICTICHETGDSYGVIRKHLGAVHPKDPRPGRTGAAAVNGNGLPLHMTLGELLTEHARAEALDRTVAKQTDTIAELRVRLRKAESELDGIKKTFAKLGMTFAAPEGSNS
jgi:uncharacterized coiled-coil protein SlyX